MLTLDDVKDDAVRLGCEPEVVLAVAEIESAGGGFAPDGFPKTLFEGHWFHKLTKGKYSVDYPTISYPKWTKEHYGKNWRAERARLDLASSLDRTAALQSASWGMFQIMGFNHAMCGYKTVQSFVNAMCKSENSQLEAFVGFVIERGLADELQRKDWHGFARLYNGPAYMQNDYAGKMERAYKKHKGI
jgi:hypothetical protein